MPETDLSLWEGDGLPDYEDWLLLTDELGMVGPELEEWLRACKREAWVHEHLAKYENKEWNLAVTRYFWRRVEKLNSYIKRMEAELDATTSDNG
jgi:hypothetical protein